MGADDDVRSEALGLQRAARERRDRVHRLGRDQGDLGGSRVVGAPPQADELERLPGEVADLGAQARVVDGEMLAPRGGDDDARVALAEALDAAE